MPRAPGAATYAAAPGRESTRRTLLYRLSLARSPRARRWWRYGVTSAAATLISETALLALYGDRLLGATAAAVVATAMGSVPSYLLSRYWIWPDANRKRAERQVLGYWTIAFASLAASSVGTSVAASHAPAGHLAHLLVVGIAYVGMYGALWIVKFFLYQSTLFRPRTEPRSFR